MGRPFGSKDSYKRSYKFSEACQVARELGGARSLEVRKVVSDGDVKLSGVGRKRGELSRPIVDGLGHLKKLNRLTSCLVCGAKLFCPKFECLKGETDSKTRMRECPLYSVYRMAVVDVVQNPLAYLSRKAADLDVALEMQRMKDSESGTPISKEMIAATKVALEAVKVAEKAKERLDRKGGRPKRRSYDDRVGESELVIDVEDLVEGGMNGGENKEKFQSVSPK